MTTTQTNNEAPVKKIKEKNSVRNAEINKTDRFSKDRLFLKSNYYLLDIIHFAYCVLL